MFNIHYHMQRLSICDCDKSIVTDYVVPLWTRNCVCMWFNTYGFFEGRSGFDTRPWGSFVNYFAFQLDLGCLFSSM